MWTGTCVMFVFTALLEFAFVNYASRRDARNSKAAKSNHIYFYTGELGMLRKANVFFRTHDDQTKSIPINIVIITLILIFLDEEDEKKNDKENNDGIYNYEQESQERQEQDNSANLSVYKDSPTTRRRRVPNPQHIKLMVYYKTKPTLPSLQLFPTLDFCIKYHI